jgi:hypothetical protein
MEIRGNIKQLKGKRNTDIVVRDNHRNGIIPHQKTVKVIEVPKEKSTVEKVGGLLGHIARGLQGTADWAATTRAGSQDLDHVFGIPNGIGMDMGINGMNI